MSKTTVKKLSETLKKSLAETIAILEAAGIKDKKEGDAISSEEKMLVVTHLNKGKQAASLRRSTSQLKVMQGKAAKTVSIEVRKKTTSVKPKTPEVKPSPPQQVNKKAAAKTVRKKNVQMTILQIAEDDESKTEEAVKLSLIHI